MTAYDEHVYCLNCGGHVESCWCKGHNDLWTCTTNGECTAATAQGIALTPGTIQVQSYSTIRESTDEEIQALIDSLPEGELPRPPKLTDLYDDFHQDEQR